MRKMGIRKRWNSWALPTRLALTTAVLGLIVATLQLFEFPRWFSGWMWPNPAPTYDVALESAIIELHRSNICLTSRITEVEPDENMPEVDSNSQHPLCQIDLHSLDSFSQNYTNYLARVPYSGAESFRDFVTRLVKAGNSINSAKTVGQLSNAQNQIGMSLGEVGYWMCGMEWYLRLAPEGPGLKKQPYGGVNLNEAWDAWDDKFADGLPISVNRRKTYQSIDQSDQCSGFIDLLD